MAANEVQLSETNGPTGSPTTTDNISNINFGSADVPNLVTANHQIIQGSASYLKWIRFKLKTNNNTSDSNFRVSASTATPGTGISVGGNVQASSNISGTLYVMGGGSPGYGKTAGGAGGGGGALSPMPYNGLGQAALGNSYQNNPVAIPGNITTSNLSVGAVYGSGGALTMNGTYTDYMAVAIGTATNTPAGAMTTVTWTFTYDEI